MDARGAPERIVNAHPSDQRAQVRFDLRPTSKGPGLPTPIPAETGAMTGPVLRLLQSYLGTATLHRPAHNGLRSDHRHGIENRWKPSDSLT